jgi:hypothetical protein
MAILYQAVSGNMVHLISSFLSLTLLALNWLPDLTNTATSYIYTKVVTHQKNDIGETKKKIF